jgi:hypothetical protein
MTNASTGSTAAAKASALEPKQGAKASAPEPKQGAKAPELKFDISIPYDAAARLAYMQMYDSIAVPADWFFAEYLIDEADYATFKIAYEEAAVSEVIAKNLARQTTAVVA